MMQGIRYGITAVLAVLLSAGSTALTGQIQATSHMTPEQRAAALVRQMTLEEKIDQLHGVSNQEHNRWVLGVPRLGIPPLPMANGPAGIGPADRVQPPGTAFPAPIAVAASWDVRDAREYGVAVAGELQDIGRSMLEAPTVNIARIPTSGRTFEAYGEDPFLTSEIGVANIEGIQSLGMIANVKHFALNNQETDRLTVNAVADERTMREIYFPAFEAAIKRAHVASLMCAYNKVNGEYSCENKFLLTDVLRNDWHFDGFVVSDFGAAHSGVGDLNAGMDLEMPTGSTYNQSLLEQVKAGTISVAQIDALLEHRYAAMIRMGLFGKPIEMHPIPEKANGEVARRLAEDGMVLLRNEGSILPLDAKRAGTVAAIGPMADVNVEGGGAAYVIALHTATPVQAMEARLGRRMIAAPVGALGLIDQYATVDGLVLSPPGAKAGVRGVQAEYFDNTTFSGTPKVTRVERVPELIAEFGPPAAGLTSRFSLRWTATLTAPASGTYTLGTEVWGRAALYLDGKQIAGGMGRATDMQPQVATVHLEAGRAYTLRCEYVSTGRSIARVFWQLPEGVEPPEIAAAVAAAKRAHTAIVFAGAWSHEGYDRSTLALPGYQDRLIEAVAKANPRTIVVLETGEPVLMPWLHDVAGVLEAWFPGEEGGPAIANVLFGDVNPAGRLPLTFPASDGEVPASTPRQYPGINNVEYYSERLNVGYRWQDAEHKTPLFPFGFGLSYTHFSFSDLRATANADGDVNVQVKVTNDGKRNGAEVAQLYVGFPAEANEPPLQLKGFQKVELRAGESKEVNFMLDRRAFSYWSTEAHDWRVASGSYTIHVGDSSRNLPLVQAVRR